MNWPRRTPSCWWNRGEKFPNVVKRSDGEILIEHAGGTRNITLTFKDKAVVP